MDVNRRALEGRCGHEGMGGLCSANICRRRKYNDVNAAYAFGAAATMIQVLKQCGNDLSRDNVMKQAANLKDLAAPILYARHEDQHFA